MRQLPLWRRVVFVDWHGVLSRDPFWTSIRNSSTHPLRTKLEAGLADIFVHQGERANAWMKGLLSTTQIIEAMDIHLDRRFRDDFLLRRMDIDCAQMKVNVELFEVLRKTKEHASVVLATDNMDTFVRTFELAYARRRRPRADSETLADWAIICDDIICSSDIGTLKAENPAAFFGPWLRANGLEFCNAALIDDRADNCAAFAGQGGTPIQYKMTTGDVADVTSSLENWLAQPL